MPSSFPLLLLINPSQLPLLPPPFNPPHPLHQEASPRRINAEREKGIGGGIRTRIGRIAASEDHLLLKDMVVREEGGGFIGHLLLLLGFLAAAAAPQGMAGGSHLHRERAHRRAERLMASLAAPSPAPSISLPASGSSRVYHLTDYGADPTATTDSSAAIAKAISAAFQTQSNRVLIEGITDLGGAEIHLDGGTYLIKTPMTLPAGGGNLKIHGGSLRASDDFPTDRYVIELRSSSASSLSASTQEETNATQLSSSSGYDYEYITLRDLLVDANFRGGGIAVANALRTTVDNCYVDHFTSDGILVRAGHETYISNSYIGQHITAGGDPGEENFTGVGINLIGNDNAVTDVVIFSAAIGVQVSGQANTLTGVHCYNKATGWGGTGIYLKLPGLTQTRILNCYLDYTGIVSEDPVQLLVSGSFFLGDANVVLKSVKGVIRAVDIVDNLFSGGGNGVEIVRLDETGGQFTDVDQVVVERNGVNGMKVRSTVAKAAVEANGTTWAVDFSPVLLFKDRIDHVQYTLSAGSAFPNHALRNVSGNQVVIESNVAVTGTVYVAVDQFGGTMG